MNNKKISKLTGLNKIKKQSSNIIKKFSVNKNQSFKIKNKKSNKISVNSNKTRKKLLQRIFNSNKIKKRKKISQKKIVKFNFNSNIDYVKTENSRSIKPSSFKKKVNIYNKKIFKNRQSCNPTNEAKIELTKKISTMKNKLEIIPKVNNNLLNLNLNSNLTVNDSKKNNESKFNEFYKIYKLHNDDDCDYNGFFKSNKKINLFYEEGKKKVNFNDKKLFELVDFELFKYKELKLIKISHINLEIKKNTNLISSIQFVYNYINNIIEGKKHGNLFEKDLESKRINIDLDDKFIKIIIIFKKRIKFIKIFTQNNKSFEFGEFNFKDNYYYLNIDCTNKKQKFLKSFYLNSEFIFLKTYK